MEETPFDPYYRWLGIPASEQPADHYRLLGIVRFESNREIIDNASQRQISFVRTFALGEHAEHSQTLLNELAAARSILLNPASKETYDESLREQKEHSEPILAPSPNFPDAEVLSSQSSTIDIDPPSVVHAKLQCQENQDPSKSNLSVLLGSFILIISAGLLWGLIRVGQSKIKFISGPPPLAVAPFDAEQAKAYQEAWAKYLGLPKTMTNSIGMEFVLIPPGQFEAGAVGDGQDLAGRFKVSQRKVSIDLPYYISTTEITESQAVKLGWEAPATVNQPSELPASGMHWHEAIRLLNQLSKLDGVAANYLLEDGKIIDQLDQYGYRLPSSDEWEFASRAGTVTRYFFGDEPDQIEEYSSIKSIMPVASGKANPFGLYDVHGNASEWVQQNGMHEWKDNDGSHMHEMRGVSVPNAPQCAGNDFKNWHKRSNQWSNLGFRILLEISDLSK